MINTLSVHAPSPRRPQATPNEHDPSTVMAQRDIPTRLLSPIRIPDLPSRSPSSATSSPICSPIIKRRRAHPNLFQHFSYTQCCRPNASPVRQRHCKKADCCIVPSPLSATPFDELPWKSLLDQYPSPTTLSPVDSISAWDLPDLPIPTVDDGRRNGRHTGRLGPIRSRKSAPRLRSVPFPTSADFTSDPPSALPELSPTYTIDEDSDEGEQSPVVDLPSIRIRTWSGSSEDSEPPKTPPQRATALPAVVDFRNLMPVFLSDSAIESPWSR